MFTCIIGGAGPTILTATFLLLGENVLTYEKGVESYKKSATNKIRRDFGDLIFWASSSTTRCHRIPCSGDLADRIVIMML